AGEADPDLIERVKLAASGQAKSSKPAVAEPVAAPPQAAATPSTEGFPKNEALRAHVVGRLNAGATVAHIKVGIDPRCAFKGVRAFLVVKNLAKAGTILATQPAGKDLEAGNFDLTFDAWV